jgi:hypothetical protein
LSHCDKTPPLAPVLPLPFFVLPNYDKATLSAHVLPPSLHVLPLGKSTPPPACVSPLAPLSPLHTILLGKLTTPPVLMLFHNKQVACIVLHGNDQAI